MRIKEEKEKELVKNTDVCERLLIKEEEREMQEELEVLKFKEEELCVARQCELLKAKNEIAPRSTAALEMEIEYEVEVDRQRTRELV